MKVTPAIASQYTQGKPLTEVNSIDLSNQNVTHVEDISIMVNLRRLNLSKNKLKNADSVFSGIRYCKGLSWLNLMENQLDSLDGVENIPLLGGKPPPPLVVMFCSLVRAVFFTIFRYYVILHYIMHFFDTFLIIDQILFLFITINTVLNISHNEFIRIPENIAKCKTLKALILNHNNIKRIDNISTLNQLNTLGKQEIEK